MPWYYWLAQGRFNDPIHCIALSFTISIENVLKGTIMIVYTKLWDTMKAKGVSQYDLTTKHNISKSTIDRLRNNKPISIVTADTLCNILDCDVSDIMEHIKQD